MKNLNEMKNNEEFPAYVWPGGYPLYYLCEDGDILCAECAHEFEDDIAGHDVNWEDPDLFCVHCQKRIESAYAED
jgi:hypothetical protein